MLCRGMGGGVVGGQTAADNHLTFSDRLTGYFQCCHGGHLRADGAVRDKSC